jgi:NTE family protein
MNKKTALVLTGGGARGAYQAGVLKGIAEITLEKFPFQIITGVSAGSINAGFLGSKPGPFSTVAELLSKFWVGLKPDDVIKTDMMTLGGLGFRWMRDLSTGGNLGRESRVTNLLDSSPLKDFLGKRIDFGGIRRNIQAGDLHGICFTATNYRTGTAITFFDGDPAIAPWSRSARLGIRAELTLDHVLASSAIPVFFKPVLIGNSYYGDGGVRSSTPLSPAIHLGAERVLAIGIRYSRSDAMVSQMHVSSEHSKPLEITLADIGGVLMNAVFLDALDADVERMLRINQTVELLPPERASMQPYRLRKIPLLAITPSKDLGSLAADQFSKFPRIMRYLLKGTGASDTKGWDMLSYLAFDKSYTSLLVELGYEDALRSREKIQEFFSDTATD